MLKIGYLLSGLLILYLVFPALSSAQVLPLAGEGLKTWSKTGGFQRELKPSTSGTEVRLLQQLLNNIYPKDFPATNVTGTFGPKTRRTVDRLQQHFGLPGTGRLDEPTRYLLNFIYYTGLCPEASTDQIDQSITAGGRELNLPSNYAPDNLIDITNRVRTQGITCLEKDAAYRLEEMFKLANKDGQKLMVTSGFRNPAMQSFLYDYWHKEYGASADQAIASPQNSEHQLGVAVDLTGASIKNQAVASNFAKTTDGLWLEKNAYRFGYILSYPQGKSTTTGYQYEPWHWRYVGIPLANKLRKLGITYPEYLKSI